MFHLVSFDAYRSKVLAYFDPEQAAVYAQRAAWNAMQEEAIARIEALR
jgi:hypothetical protein